jgi:DNA-binding NtrC family response regulator
MPNGPPSIRAMDRLHILLVDDDFSLIDGIRRGLHRTFPGWTVYEAISVADAMRTLDRLAPSLDVVVCDLNMPELSGTKLLKLIQDMFPHIVRISLSGMLDGRSIVGATKHAECQLCKPISIEQLCNRIIQTCCARSDA